MKITFYAHACFRLEGDGVSLVTDPYTPGPNGSNFEPIDEPADIVVMSSATDRFHSDPSHVRGKPVVVNALEAPEGGLDVKGVHIDAYPAMESLTFDYGRDPDPNAMYSFALEGVRILHMGDIGNPVPPRHLESLQGAVDVVFALTGGHATIDLDDLDAALDAIRPRVVIPMHYYHERGVLDILPVDAFTSRYPPEQVRFAGGPALEIGKDTLPSERRVYVLEQSR